MVQWFNVSPDYLLFTESFARLFREPSRPELVGRKGQNSFHCHRQRLARTRIEEDAVLPVLHKGAVTRHVRAISG